MLLLMLHQLLLLLFAPFFYFYRCLLLFVTASDQTASFVIQAGNSSSISQQNVCYNFSQTYMSNSARTFTCIRPIVARYVSISRYLLNLSETLATHPPNPYILALCEVVVTGHVYITVGMTYSWYD